jgi:S-adenosyl-L-methionine hydrolase (adenosine-forming)
MPAVVAFLTDFGLDDDEAMLLKGVVWQFAPDALCADLTHAVPAQDIRAGAEILGRVYADFPPGTIFVAIVDPGVGTRRRGMAARVGSYYFVGPDNGLFSIPIHHAMQNSLSVECVELTNPKYFLPEVNPIFHGRDIFAPVGGHLAAGIPLAQFGPGFTDPILLQ